MAASAATTLAATAEMELAADTIVDAEALNFREGPWGTCINGQTFQEQAVATHRGFQYCTYFHGSGRLSIARRKLPGGDWQRIHFDDYRISHNDVHNVAVLGICPSDGTIHMAYDHHGHPLHYRVSKPEVATRPAEFPWQASLFGPTRDTLDGRAALRGVTYPMFFPAPEGGLHLFYRIGGSGNGDWQLAEYDPDDARWAILGTVLARTGKFQGSSSRCAYPNGLSHDSRGRLHLTWCWRETPDLKTNHDLMYAYSEDRGRTWRNNSEQLIHRGGGDSPVDVESPGVTVFRIAYGWGMMNQLTQDVDGLGRVHVILWHNPPDAPGPNHDLNAWRYYHYWRDASGSWQRQRLPFFGRKPRLVVNRSGDAWLAFNKGSDLEYHGQDRGGKLHVAAATARAKWKDWHVIHTSEYDCVGEPRVDLARWRAQDVLSVYVQQKPDAPGEPSTLRVLDFER
jgi:hypothetical protein